MLVSPWRKRQALAEVARRRNEADTYAAPLGMDAAAQTDEEFAEMKEFITEFYKTFYTRRRKVERDELLKKHPEVAAHLAVLVPGKVTEEEFWQRYQYRCNESRVLREWERNPDRGREARAMAIASSVQNLLDTSVLAVKNAVSTTGVHDTDLAVAKDPAGATTARSKQKKTESADDEVQVKPPAASETERNLAASLKAAADDVARWTEPRALVSEEVQVSKEEALCKTDSEAGTVLNNWLTAWFRPAVNDAVGRGKPKAPAIDSAAAVDHKRANFNPLPVNSRAQSLRDASTSQKRYSSAFQPTKEVHGKESKDAHEKAVTSPNLTVSDSEVKAASYQASSIGIALVVGFLAHALLGSVTDALCASSVHDIGPSRWWSLSGVRSNALALVCGDVSSSQLAVEVVDNTHRGWGGKNRKKKNGGSWSHDGHYPVKNNGRGRNGEFVVGGGSNEFDISSLLSSWMQNADHSQYADVGGTWDSGAVARNNNPSPVKEKSRGAVGLFRRRFGRSNNAVAEPNDVVVHQHVHHVVHHVVHEVKQV